MAATPRQVAKAGAPPECPARARATSGVREFSTRLFANRTRKMVQPDGRLSVDGAIAWQTRYYGSFTQEAIESDVKPLWGRCV